MSLATNHGSPPILTDLKRFWFSSSKMRKISCINYMEDYFLKANGMDEGRRTQDSANTTGHL